MGVESPLADATGTLLDVVETGLFGLSRGIGLVQSGLRLMAGERLTAPLQRRPIRRPADANRATAEFANRLARTAVYAGRDHRDLARVAEAVGLSVRESFSFIDWSHPRGLMDLAQLPLAAGTLGCQEALRLLYAVRTAGPAWWRLITQVAEPFIDGPVFISLQYGAQLDRLRERVRRQPGDAAGWLCLGQYAMKCGLHPEAIQAFSAAAREPSLSEDAHYLGAIANYRAGRFAEALAEATAALARNPARLDAQWWLCLAAARRGGYPETVAPALRFEVAAGRHETALRYESVGAASGVHKTSEGRGIAVFDYDNDGYLDLLIAAPSGCSLYHNRGDGTFTDESVGSGLDARVSSFAAVVGDYDNDGNADVLITRLGFLEGATSLYRNNGDGTFTDVTSEAGLDCWMATFGASWADFDGDGHLDLFIGSNLNGLFGRKQPDRLYRNNGNGTFTECAEAAGITSPWPTLGSAWGDYDNDGRPDLFLSSSFGRSQLFHNNGDGTFTNVSLGSGLDEPGLGSVAFWCDIDDDGWLDLVQYVWCPEEHYLHTLRHGFAPDGARPIRIFRNNRDGSFLDVSRERGINECWGSMSGNAGDLDNDGHLDLLLGNGGPLMTRIEPPVVLQNDGLGQFRNVTFSAGLPLYGKSHGAVCADLTGDGRLSLLLAGGGFYPGEPMATDIYRPVTRLGHFVTVRLVGTSCNRDAIGARLRIFSGGRVQHRVVSGGSGFGCLAFEQHVGLGRAATVDAIEVDWPAGGHQRIEGVPINCAIRWVQGEPGYSIVRRA